MAFISWRQLAGLGGRRRLEPIALAMAAVTLTSTPGVGEPMRAALATAYRQNPEIDAERARLRATDEDVQRARAGWAPTIDGAATLGIRNEINRPGGRSFQRPGGLGVQFSQPIFTGFRTHSAVNEAEANVRAGRAELRNIEARVLVEAATAYADVRRDRELVRLAERFVATLVKEVSAARERRSIGEVTFTDVDQARSRLAGARVELSEVTGALRSSEAEYLRVVGRQAGRTTVSGIVLGRLPKTLAEAVAVAQRESPLVIGALYREQAARHGVARERSELLPRLDLQGGYQRSYNGSEDTDRSDTAELFGRLQVPLYQGGGQRARVRQAKHVHVGRLQEVETARRRALADLRAAWAGLMTSRKKTAIDRQRISFAVSALKGVREEERVGQRTLLDVLNAEEELFQARSSLEQNFRDTVVSHYEVLRALGRLDSGFLQLAEVQYDPERHYFDARGKWFTTSIANERRDAPGRAVSKPAKGPRVAGWRTTSAAIDAKPAGRAGRAGTQRGSPASSEQRGKRRRARAVAAGRLVEPVEKSAAAKVVKPKLRLLSQPTLRFSMH
jgi:outer membrane protein